MRKAIAILGMTGALTFGGASLAHATTVRQPHSDNDNHLGSGRGEDHGGQHRPVGTRSASSVSLGLLGLKRRNDHTVATAPGTARLRQRPAHLNSR